MLFCSTPVLPFGPKPIPRQLFVPFLLIPSASDILLTRVLHPLLMAITSIAYCLPCPLVGLLIPIYLTSEVPTTAVASLHADRTATVVKLLGWRGARGWSKQEHELAMALSEGAGWLVVGRSPVSDDVAVGCEGKGNACLAICLWQSPQAGIPIATL